MSHHDKPCPYICMYLVFTSMQRSVNILVSLYLDRQNGTSMLSLSLTHTHTHTWPRSQENGCYMLGTDFKAGQTKFKTAAVEYIRSLGMCPKVHASIARSRRMHASHRARCFITVVADGMEWQCSAALAVSWREGGREGRGLRTKCERELSPFLFLRLTRVCSSGRSHAAVLLVCVCVYCCG